MSFGCLVIVAWLGSLYYSHHMFSMRAATARMLPEGETARAGRIYFLSFPENRSALSIWGWNPNIGHATLMTRDRAGLVKQYDYGWFVGYEGGAPDDAIGYVDDSPSYGVVTRRIFPLCESAQATNDMEIARMVLEGMSMSYGNKVELWAKDVADIGIAERYMELLAADKNRGAMVWRCWQIGGYRCGNIARQAFDAARGEGHFLDLLWGGFPGADAPSIGTDKTVFIPDDHTRKYIEAEREVEEIRKHWAGNPVDVTGAKVRAWVKAGVPPNRHLGGDWNLLSWAVELQDDSLVELLINKDAKENETIRSLLLEAKKGDADAMNKLGICFVTGDRVTTIHKVAFYWFAKAAEHNHLKGLYNLAKCYNDGTGIEKDTDKAKGLIEKRNKLLGETEQGEDKKGKLF